MFGTGARSPTRFSDDLRKMDGEGTSLTVIEERRLHTLRFVMRSHAGVLFTRYTEDGLFPRSTTAPLSGHSELSLPEGKNFLFAGSDCGGRRAAAMYTLIGSAKAQRTRSGTLPPHRAGADR